MNLTLTEAERLRSALQDIADGNVHADWPDLAVRYEKYAAAALAALAEKAKPKECPFLLAAREILALDSKDYPDISAAYLSGAYDSDRDVQQELTTLKRGMAIAIAAELVVPVGDEK